MKAQKKTKGKAEVVIEFRNVYKSYPLYHHLSAGLKNLILHLPSVMRDFMRERFTALRDISFAIHRGECVGVFGRNGAGKSTTLGLIARVLHPSSGTVTVNGKVSPLLALGAGFHPDLTGRENIALNGVLMGCLREEISAKTPAIIEFSELGHFIDEPIRTYSTGMLARLGFSVAAHLDPEILLLDEILAVGDVDFQQKCLKKINEFRDRRVTIVIVSHSLAQLEEMCDRVVWIDESRIRMLDTPKKVARAFAKSQQQGEHVA